ncbi:MAG: ABC transporter permease [Mycobacterium leprae]
MKSRWLYLLLGFLLVGTVAFVALFADHVTPVSPYYMDERTSVLDGKAPFPPGGSHLLGTDQFGRDIWSRVAYGARWSLLFAGLVMACRLLFAVPLGIAAAFGPEFFRWLVRRLYIFSGAIPPLLIYIAFLSIPWMRYIGLWPNVTLTVLILTIVEAPRVAVNIQGRLEELSGEPFVEGAIAVGAPRLRIFSRHLLPHLFATFLQLIASEMGRALLVLAQLGLFGIWIGGGILEFVGQETSRLQSITGIPEWGTLLAEGRLDARTHPWIAMAPATAFLIGVVGFNLLAQGLEGLSFSLYRFRENVTGRVSARWRWLALPVSLALILVWYQGVTRDDAPVTAALAQQQTQLLTDRNLDGYMATLSDNDPTYKAEQRRWVQTLMDGNYQVGVVQFGELHRDGRNARAVETLSFGYDLKPPVTVSRAVRLIRTGNSFTTARGDLSVMRGFHTDLLAAYDPVDSSQAAATVRWDIRKISTVADRAYENVAKYFPDAKDAPRPQIMLYRTHEAFTTALGPAAGDRLLVYVPGEALHVSPQILHPYDPWDLERTFTHAMVQILSHDRLGRDTVDPVALGLYDMKAAVVDGEYTVNIFSLADQRILSLPELYQQKLGKWDDRFLLQSALLGEYLQLNIPYDNTAHSLADLAKAAGMSEAELTEGYAQYVRNRLLKASPMLKPEERAQVPASLLQAIQSQTNADGFDSYTIEPLDVRVSKDGSARLLALARFRVAGQFYNVVLSQQWKPLDGAWMLVKGIDPRSQVGR